jgi:hypothetical protein
MVCESVNRGIPVFALVYISSPRSHYYLVKDECNDLGTHDLKTLREFFLCESGRFDMLIMTLKAICVRAGIGPLIMVAETVLDRSLL